MIDWLEVLALSERLNQHAAALEAKADVWNMRATVQELTLDLRRAARTIDTLAAALAERKGDQ